MNNKCRYEFSSRFSYEEFPTFRYLCKSIAGVLSREKQEELLKMTKQIVSEF